MPGPLAPSGLFATAAAAKEGWSRAPAATQVAEVRTPPTAAGDVSIVFDDGCEEAVAVDKTLGPMWISEATGAPTKRFGAEGNGKVNLHSGGFGTMFAKKWADLSSTEREILLLTTARRQRSLREAAADRTEEEAAALVVKAPPRVRPLRLVDRRVRPGRPPLLVCWYSGGFFKSAGEKLLEPLLKASKAWGIPDYLVLHHTNEYGFEGEGYKDWPAYVDRLIEEINKVSDDRPLILFGHSKGVCPALSVATRMGRRVQKVYLTSCGGWMPQTPTPWEHTAASFQQGDDQMLMAWFSSLNPSDILLATAANAKPHEFSGLIKGSAFLTKMLNLMRLQYKYAMFPDMSKKVIDVFPADICAISPVLDPGASPQHMQPFSFFTKGSYQVRRVMAGHMDILANPSFHNIMLGDMKALYP